MCVFSNKIKKKKNAMLMWLGVLSNILAMWKCIKLIWALVHRKEQHTKQADDQGCFLGFLIGLFVYI